MRYSALKTKTISFILFVSAIFLFIDTKGQEADYKTSFTDAEYYFLYNDFAEALPLYQKALEAKPGNVNMHYRIGLCLLNIPGLKHNAIPFLEKAVQKINKSYQEGSHKEEGAPVNSFFHLGEAYRIANRFDEAIEAYSTFRNMLDTRDLYNLDYVDQQISASKRAKSMIKDTTPIKLNPISLFPFDNYTLNPSVSGDGNSLLFTVKEKFYDAVYISTKTADNEWGNPINITLDIGVEGDAYATSINYDGTQIFLFRNDRGTGNLYTSQKNNGKWGKIKKLGRTINSRNWETHASISPDNQTLFFTSNQRGGHGGLDIYYSKRSADGEWGNAINLGPTINTPHNEEIPYLSADGKTLYFASQGHNSMGGYDIFYSERLGENEWSTPTNMGYPINTTDDNLSYFPLTKDQGLITMVEHDSPNVRKMFQLSILSEKELAEINITGKLSLANSFEVQENQFSISLIDLEKKKVIESTSPRASTGEFSFKVKPGSYKVEAQGEGYTSVSAAIVIPTNYSNPEYPLDLRMIPEQVSTGEFLAVRSILFDFDCSDLTRDATIELEKVYTIMNKYPSLSIEISGHTDNKGSASYNYKLSLKRAESVIDYLSERRIPKERLVARGASAFENIATNYLPDGSDNPEGRSLNRRASIKVLKSDENISITEALDIPEHLKPQEQDYTLLLAPINSEVNSRLLSKIEKHSGLKGRKLDGFKNQFAMALGLFEHKSEAIELLNYAIDNGFPMATLIGKNDLNTLIGRPLAISRSSLKEDDRLYTIQVKAHVVKITDYTIFKELNVREVLSDDGLYLYIYGEFRGKNAALDELERLKKMGFEDAFIMNLDLYQNKK